MDDLTQLAYAVDTFYFLVMGALVMFMAPGFAMLEAGMVRAKNTSEILTKNIALFSIACIMYILVGYNLMYGNYVPEFMLGAEHSVDDVLASGGDTYYSARSDFFFQVVFVATAMSIISGAVAERIKLWSFLLFAVVMTGFIYPIQGSWSWGHNGFLSDLGFIDFAGSGIVHMCGAAAALAGVILLGPRAGKYNEDGSINAMPGANMPLATLGTFILWFGWFGFNGGSQLAVNGAELPFTTTHISAAAGLIAWGFIEYINEGKSTSVGMATGAVSGLVGVTPAAGFVNPASGMIIGLLTSILCYYSIKLKNRLQFDDSLDTFAVHGVGGTAGALLTGVFARYDLISAHPAGQVLLEQGRIGLILGQFQAVLVAYGISALGTLLIALILKKLGIKFRVTKEQEEKGLDFTEHREKSYT